MLGDSEGGDFSEISHGSGAWRINIVIIMHMYSWCLLHDGNSGR
jgi:hypothetical protein